MPKRQPTTARRCAWAGRRVWAQLTHLVYLFTLATQKHHSSLTVQPPTPRSESEWWRNHSKPEPRTSPESFFILLFFLWCAKCVICSTPVCNISSSELPGLTPVQHTLSCVTRWHKHLHLITNLFFLSNCGSFHGSMVIKEILLCQRLTLSGHILKTWRLKHQIVESSPEQWSIQWWRFAAAEALDENWGKPLRHTARFLSFCLLSDFLLTHWHSDASPQT